MCEVIDAARPGLGGEESGDNVRHDLTMFVQPIVALATGAPFAAEALARFPASPGTPVSDVFASARDAGQGPALEAGCLRAAWALRAELPPDVLLSVNVSADALDAPVVAAQLIGNLHAVILELHDEPQTSRSIGA